MAELERTKVIILTTPWKIQRKRHGMSNWI